MKLHHHDRDLLAALKRADLVVHEVFGTIASEEDIVQISNSLLKARGSLVASAPAFADTLVALVLKPKLWQEAATADHHLYHVYLSPVWPFTL
jgi:hypothetical protein